MWLYCVSAYLLLQFRLLDQVGSHLNALLATLLLHFTMSFTFIHKINIFSMIVIVVVIP